VSELQLPLFPLGRAVVPGAQLKLQLFEQRYLKLARDCLAAEHGFGVVGIKSGGEAIAESQFYQSGCRVQIEDWDQLQNGLLGISVRADKRFVIKSCSQQDDGLWVAQVELLADESSAPLGSKSDYQGLIDLYHSLAAHSGQTVDPTEDAAILGWAIANLLPIDNADFAELLAENDPLKRLHLLATKIDQLSLQ
jgi:uncharacterized protein